MNVLVRIGTPLVLAVSILSSASAATFVEVNGVVSMEAENPTKKTGTWINNPALSGGSMMQNDGCKGGADDYLMYEIEFTTTGTYYLWFLSRVPDPNNNANDDFKIWLDTPSSKVHGGENRGRDYEAGMYWGPQKAGSWYDAVYRSIGKDPWGWSNKAKDKEKIYQRRSSTGALSCQWDIKTAGKHTIHVVKGHEPEHCDGKEYGFDKLVLMLNGTESPNGIGPAKTVAGKTGVRTPLRGSVQTRTAADMRSRSAYTITGRSVPAARSLPNGRVSNTTGILIFKDIGAVLHSNPGN